MYPGDEEQTKNKQQRKNYFTMGLIAFYVVCLIFAVIVLIDWWNDKETFYLKSEQVSLNIHGTYKIDLYGKTEEKNNRDYLFETENSEVAVVDKNGVIEAKSEGETYVTIKSKWSSKEKNLLVHVQGDSIYSLEFENDNIDLYEGDTTQLKPIINGDPNFKTEILWSTSNSKIVFVTKDGELNASSQGEAYITATVKNTSVSTKAKVRVFPQSDNDGNGNGENKEVDIPIEEEDVNAYLGVSSISLTSKKTSISVGEKLTLSYQIEPKKATNKQVIFESNNPNVAVVSSTGVVTGKSDGKADITVTTVDGNKTAFITITVSSKNVAVSAVKLNKNNTTLLVGGSEQLVAFTLPFYATNKKVVWKSSNPDIVKVDDKGKITGVRAGSALVTVTSTDGSVKDTCTVKINEKEVKVKKVSLNPSKLELHVGDIYSLMPTITPVDATNQNVLWSSSNPKVATVSDSGVVTANSSGTTTITATTVDGNKKATVKVTVPIVKVSKITLGKTSVQVQKDGTYQLKVSISPSDVTNKNLYYSTSDAKIAKVDETGKITGVSLGSATIKVVALDGSGKVATLNVVVVPKGSMIDIRKKKYKTYYTNILLNENFSKKESKHVQNFAIENIGTSKETLYFSTVRTSVFQKKPNTKQAAELNRSIVFKVPKSAIKIPTSKARKVMYLEDSGHGQAFDIDTEGMMWMNAYGTAPALSNGYYWGGHSGIMRIAFTANKEKDTIKPTMKVQIKDSNGNVYKGSGQAIDEENNLFAYRTGWKVFVYDLKQLKKGKLVLLYSFKLSSNLKNYSNGDVVYRQGDAIHNGYYYLYRGAPGKQAYIEVFNFLGELQYVYKVPLSTSNKREPEGLKIYNNKIYIGSTHTMKNISGKVFDIGYFN